MEEREGDEPFGDSSLAEFGEQALSATSDGDMQKFGEWQVDGGVGETRAGAWNLGEPDRRALRPRTEGENQTVRVPSADWERNLLNKGEREGVVCLAHVAKLLRHQAAERSMIKTVIGIANLFTAA